MKKEEKKNSSVKKKKNVKYKMVNMKQLKKVELIVSVLVGVVFLVLLFFAITNEVFIPATLITLALFLFCICYYYIDDENKKKFVYILFGVGVILIITEVIYTIMRIIHG